MGWRGRQSGEGGEEITLKKKTGRSQITKRLVFHVRSLGSVLQIIGNLLRILRRCVIVGDLYFINIILVEVGMVGTGDTEGIDSS